MTARTALPCPKCKRVLKPLSWHSEDDGMCVNCETDFKFIGFPALTAAAVRIVPKDVLLAEHATCFYHAENQAEVVCDGCGRFLCTVCAIDFSGRKLCPSCMAATNAKDTQAVSQRTLYDGIALSAALFPLLIWPVTAVTAPMALGLVIFGWNRPRSLVRSGRAKLIIAGVFALLEMSAWTTFIVWRWLK